MVKNRVRSEGGTGLTEETGGGRTRDSGRRVRLKVPDDVKPKDRGEVGVVKHTGYTTE